MIGRMAENNKVEISGEIVGNFEFSHDMFGENFYTAHLSSERNSGTADVIPVMVSDRLIDVNGEWKGRCVYIDGGFRSYNKHKEGKNRLILYAFASELEVLEGRCDSNHIFVDGYICKIPAFRITPLGREISDIILAVNRSYGKSDYLPCVVWGRNARFASGLNVGTHVSIEGRIQSRKYKKRIGETEVEERVAYEISGNKIEVLEEAES